MTDNILNEQPPQPPARKPRRWPWIVAIVAALVIGVSLASIGDTEDPTVKTASPSPAAHPTPADEPDTPPAQPEEEEPEPEPESDETIAKIGNDEWFEYEDGLEVQVTKAESFTLGEYAFSGDAGETGVVVTVTIKNGTGVAFDTSLGDVFVTYGPNGNSTEREYDEAGFEGNIPPGKTATAKHDFGVVPEKHLDDILVEVVPSWDHSSSFFEGSAK